MPGNQFKLYPGVLTTTLDREVRKWLKGTTAKAERYAKERTPVDTGRLRSSISHRIESTPLRGIIGTNVKYAAPVEFGNRGRTPVGMLRGGAEQAVQEET